MLEVLFERNTMSKKSEIKFATVLKWLSELKGKPRSKVRVWLMFNSGERDMPVRFKNMYCPISALCSVRVHKKVDSFDAAADEGRELLGISKSLQDAIVSGADGDTNVKFDGRLVRKSLLQAVGLGMEWL